MATDRLRAVFDTNVIVAALKSRNPQSPTAELLRHWLAGEFDLLYSIDLRTEYTEKFLTRVVEPLRAQTFLSRLEEFGMLVAVPAIEAVIEADPDDDIVLACAVAGGATHLVTYDPHFLPLGKDYHGVRIVDGLHFLYFVRGDAPPGI